MRSDLDLCTREDKSRLIKEEEEFDFHWIDYQLFVRKKERTNERYIVIYPRRCDRDIDLSFQFEQSSNMCE